MPKISLIIPVYNAELYLRKTLDSVLNQTYKDFEVVAINDGSTDSSLNILEEYKLKFDKITIINQNNKGIGITRNEGIKAAKGEYISFLDSDDFISNDYLETLYKLITKSDADISCCNFNFYSDHGINFPMPFSCKPGVYSSDEALKNLILDLTIHHFSWGKLYKRELFINNDIKFYNMYFEDVATCPKIFYFAKKVAITNKSMYYYRRHRSSILSTLNSIQINDLIISVGILRSFLESKKIYNRYKMWFNLYACRIEFQVFALLFYKHIVHMSLSNFLKNFKKTVTLFKLFREKVFQLSGDPPMLPFYLDVPSKKTLKTSNP